MSTARGGHCAVPHGTTRLPPLRDARIGVPGTGPPSGIGGGPAATVWHAPGTIAWVTVRSSIHQFPPGYSKSPERWNRILTSPPAQLTSDAAYIAKVRCVPVK